MNVGDANFFYSHLFLCVVIHWRSEDRFSLVDANKVNF